MSDDQDLLQRIKALVEEEHELDRAGAADKHERRVHLEEQLDQCWDLLRQRQARRQYGENPDEAKPRPVSQVEGYLQ
jgi:phosphoglycerate-specific signal transduction histidine kinase